MARHVSILTGESFNSDTELGSKLAKAIFDVVNGKTVVALTATPQGRLTAVIIVTDDV